MEVPATMAKKAQQAVEQGGQAPLAGARRLDLRGEVCRVLGR